MKTVFFGTPAFAAPFLQTLIDDPDTEVVAVVCQPDKPVGRKQELKAPPTKQLAQEAGIPVMQFGSLRKAEAQEDLQDLHADVFVVVAYGKILPQEVLDIAPNRVINVHPSLLPKYRGPSPMQWAIREGDAQTGVSIMVLDAGMDTGPVLSQESIEIDAVETYESLQQKVHAVGPGQMLKTIKQYLNEEIEPRAQDDAEATITKLLTRDDARIDWSRSAKEIDQQIRAYTPWPGSWTMFHDKRLKIISASVSDANGQPGVVAQTDNQILVGTSHGSLALQTIQLEGKQQSSAEDFAKGHQDFVNTTLT